MSASNAPTASTVISDIAFHQAGARIFGANDFFGRNVVIALVVEGMDDGGGQHAGEAEHGHQPHVPDQREADYGAEGGDHKSGGRGRRRGGRGGAGRRAGGARRRRGG